jgi:hypothetical protein
MTKKALALGSIIALVGGVLLFAVPSVSLANITITTIGVSNTGTGGTGNFTGANPAGNTWDLGAGGITLAPGQSLVLTQNQAGAASTLPTGLPGFNFDTSENSGHAATQYTVTVNGTNSFLDTSVSGTAGVLNDGGLDQPTSTTHNEAANWVKIGTGPGYDLFVGYADTLHSGSTDGACADGGNCLPFFGTGVNNIWDGSGTSTAATRFLGHASNLPGYTQPTSGTHCNVNEAAANTNLFNCFDAGAILIVATSVAEPSTVLLVGIVMIGLMGWSLRRPGMAV